MKFLRQHILSLLSALGILLLSAIPVGALPKVEIPNIDKPVHFLMYAILTVAILLDRIISHRSIGRWFIFAPLIAILYGGAMEILQSFLAYRSCSVYDFIANDIGALIGVLLFALIHKLTRKS